MSDATDNRFYRQPIEATILDPEWTFTASVITPEGIRVETTITVPVREAPGEIHALRELSEISHMCAARAIEYVRKEKTP